MANAPCREAIERAVAANGAAGNENLGFLSELSGFLPSAPPLAALPESHRPWDEAARSLPSLMRELRVREAVDGMPVLSAGPEALADRYLLRASQLMAMLAHAYWRNQPEPPERLPECLARPWEQATQRLGRPAGVLHYVDLILYNWRLRDPSLPDPIRLENLDLLVPTVGVEEERIFYMVQLEMQARGAPLVGSIARSQEAILRGDRGALKGELHLVRNLLRHLGEVTFQKIDVNPHSPSFCDPAVWGKVVGPFAVPIAGGRIGADGTAAPMFHALDSFLGRARYDSKVARTSAQVREGFPKNWIDYLDAVNQVDVRAFVEQSGDRELRGLYRGVLEAYAGDKGLLGVHRLKAYGFLEVAFKIGRSETVGGFKGMFKDRTWVQSDIELERARCERYEGLATETPAGPPQGELKLEEQRSGWVARVDLDVEGAGVHYRTGDRVGVLPENSDELVDRTLEALRAQGTEQVRLDPAWRSAIWHRRGASAEHLPLSVLLKYGRIRPVDRAVAKALAALSGSSRLRRVINARSEDQWELWDLLSMVGRGGFDTTRLWKAEPWEPESICKIIPPEDFRLYSISSSMEGEGASAPRVQLTVGGLSYRTRKSEVSEEAQRQGTASHFLMRAASRPEAYRTPIALKIVPAPRFHLPESGDTPIILFAGGAGISPFRGFMQERVRTGARGDNWLFFGTRTRHDLHCADELERWVAGGWLKLRVAFSGEDTELSLWGEGREATFRFMLGERRRIDRLIDEHAEVLRSLLRPASEGGKGGVIYVCGRTGFAVSVMEGIKRMLARFAPAGADPQAFARAELFRMNAEGRYRQDVFTTHSSASPEGLRLFDASEVCLHNSAEQGYWLVINGKVYDMTEFAQLHPGGARIVYQYAGLDATQAYRAVLHHLNPEVDALLGMYELGAIRRLDFGPRWGVSVGAQGLEFTSLSDIFRRWVRYLHGVIEMQNAFRDDLDFMRRPCTAGDAPGQMTPQRALLFSESHRRFLEACLDALLGDELSQLWAVTVGLCDPYGDVRAIQAEVAAVASSPGLAAARAAPAALRAWSDRLKQQGDAAGWAEVARVAGQIAAEDAKFFEEMKHTARQGVALFERHQGEVAQAAARELLSCLRQLPRVAARYAEAFAALSGSLSG